MGAWGDSLGLCQTQICTSMNQLLPRAHCLPGSYFLLKNRPHRGDSTPQSHHILQFSTCPEALVTDTWASESRQTSQRLEFIAVREGKAF